MEHILNLNRGKYVFKGTQEKIAFQIEREREKGKRKLLTKNCVFSEKQNKIKSHFYEVYLSENWLCFFFKFSGFQLHSYSCFLQIQIIREKSSSPLSIRTWSYEMRQTKAVSVKTDLRNA